MTHSISYVSTADPSLRQEALSSLLDTTKHRNEKSNISGILLYADGNFMQVLEGHQEQVERLFEKICLDARHSNVIKVASMDYKHPIFKGYASGFSVIERPKDTQSLKTYLNWLKNHPSKKVNKMIDLVENFIDHS